MMGALYHVDDGSLDLTSSLGTPPRWMVGAIHHLGEGAHAPEGVVDPTGHAKLSMVGTLRWPGCRAGWDAYLGCLARMPRWPRCLAKMSRRSGCQVGQDVKLAIGMSEVVVHARDGTLRWP